ncbi:MAG: sensor domain-containing protein [Leptospirales bacterium]
MRQKRDVGETMTADDLRIAAEKKVALATKEEDGDPQSKRLMHELQIHQVELDMQNEELRRTQSALEESRNRYMDLYEFAPVGYVTLSREAIVKEINLSGSTLFGVDRNQMLNHRFATFVAPEDREEWYRNFQSVLSHEGEQSFELNLIHSNQTQFQAFVNCLPVSRGEMPVVRIAITDVSALKRAEEELRIAAIAFNSHEAMLLTDSKGVILRINEAFTHRTGYEKEMIVGKNLIALQSGRHDQSFYQRQYQALKEGHFWQGEMWNRGENGKIYAEWVTISAVIDKNDICTHFLHTFSDITHNREAEAEIHRLAYYDALTHLPNRRMLLERIGQALITGKLNGTHGAVIFLDLDHFKALNDTLGHDVGDQLLVEIAKRLEKTLSKGHPVLWPNCTISRLGGDEFVILLEEMSADPSEAAMQARHVSGKLQEALSSNYSLTSANIFCTTSMGITLFFDHNTNTNTLLKQADLALYRAKKTGCGNSCFFDSKMQIDIDHQRVEEASLSQALASNQFQLYYQSETDREFRVIGAEALLRWKHPELGLTAPNGFIDLAEQTRLILPIGRWVLESACSQIGAWSHKKETRDLKLSINVSARQFHHPQFLSEVMSALAKTGADPTRLTIDLSEAVILTNMEQTISTINKLRQNGVSSSLDGFGSGLSSLEYLKRLPVFQVKIDQSLVRNITRNPGDAAIVAGIISIGKALGIKVNAQGAETEEQLRFLESHGCDSYQGYLISPPISPEEFEEYLSGGGARLETGRNR